MLSYLALAIAMPLVQGGQEPPSTKGEALAASLDVDTIAQMMEVENDPLDTKITVSSYSFFVSKRDYRAATYADRHLRGFIDKKSRRSSVQVYVALIDKGRNAPRYNRVNYETSEGPVEAQTTSVGYDAQCHRYGCDHLEDVVFTVPIEQLREATVGAIPGEPNVWRFRIYGAGGNAVTMSMLRTEIAGFMKAFDAQRATVRNVQPD